MPDGHFDRWAPDLTLCRVSELSSARTGAWNTHDKRHSFPYVWTTNFKYNEGSIKDNRGIVWTYKNFSNLENIDIHVRIVPSAFSDRWNPQVQVKSKHVE